MTEEAVCGEPALPDILPVVVNAAAGGALNGHDLDERLRRAFTAIGRRVECRILKPDEISEHFRALVRERPMAVGVAGGDGTLSTAAKLLAPAGILLVALPLGTRNHFAQDLGVPLDLEEAVQALAEGCIRAIDVGEVNGRLFLNNASVGLYTRAVRWRQSLLAENWLVGKRLATLYVLALMARRLPRYRLFLELDDGDTEALCVPFLFIGNNRYAERALELVSRQRLDAGWLHLAYPERADFGAILRLVVGLLLRPLARLPDLHARDVRRLRLNARRKHLTVALDGELHRLAQPLEFRIRERFLRVLMPKSS